MTRSVSDTASDGRAEMNQVGEVAQVGQSLERKTSCVVCGADVESILISKNGCDVYQCPDCGLAFTYPQPQSLAEQYDDSYFDLYRLRRQFRLKRADSRLRKIETIKKPGRLLDIGCSLGYFVEAAQKRGWGASGIEISPFAAAEARDMGLDVRTGVLEDAGYASESFDCVTMWDVLEHVADPVAHMLEVRRILADGGLVVVGTPDLAHVCFRVNRHKWRHLKPSEHIFYFRRSSIARLMEKTGFKMVTPSGGSPVTTLLGRYTQWNDVMIIYGVKDGV